MAAQRTPGSGGRSSWAYAAGAAPTRDWLAGRAHPAFADAAAAITAIAPVGKGRVPALLADEFVVLLSGELTLDTSRGTSVVKPGQSLVLPAGISFGWSAEAGTLAVIVACPGAAGTDGFNAFAFGFPTGVRLPDGAILVTYWTRDGDGPCSVRWARVRVRPNLAA